MYRIIIERDVPGASELSDAQVAEIARTSNAAVASLGVPYVWLSTFIAGDRFYCVHETDDAEAILEHARRGGFPVNRVSLVSREIGPRTADERL